MKKIEKVSIADISFTLDNDAYVSLRQYLDSLHSYYDKDPDGSEIIADIEARIAELILNEQVYTKIVSKQLIDSIIAQLGTPEEIEEQADERTDGYAPLPDPSIPRRLYRNREGRILGGVCSGMAHFWDISVAWIRLAFLAPMILFILAAPFHWHWVKDFALGWSWVFIVIYVVLWFAIPMAKTPRQKLESRGEKITPSSIRQNLQEGARTPSGKKAASVVAEILAVVGRVLLFFIKLVVAVIGFSFVIAAFSILIGIIVGAFNPATIGIVTATSLAGLTILTPLVFALLLMFCIMIPLFVVGVALLSMVFSWKPGKVFYGVLLGIWLLAMIFCSVVIANNARYLRDELRHGDITIGWTPDRHRNHIQIKQHRTGDGRKTIRVIRDGSDAEEIRSVDIDVAEDSLVVIVKKLKDGSVESDTLTIGESDSGAGRITIRRTDN